MFIPYGGAASTLNVRGWSGDHDVLRFDVTNTGHNGQTARITGKEDFRGTVNADFDLDLPPYDNAANAPRIRGGTGGVIRKFVSPVKYIQVPVVVAKLHFESAVENQVKYSFDVEMSILFGDLIWPAA